jgi:ABC-type molybdenum transport system ATPase subunit/photorepair protein PhrA
METKNTEMDGQDIFITEILVNKCRHIRDFKILLSKKEHKHLIITGKNGSGKTSLLEIIIKEIT